MRMIRLTEGQIASLIDDDWLGGGPVRLNRSLGPDTARATLVVPHARMVLEELARDGGVKLTATGNFNRKFVREMFERFRWPNVDPELYFAISKVANQRDLLPLDYLYAVLLVAGLARKYRGSMLATRRGRSLLASDAAGELYATLFQATFKKFDLGYLDAAAKDDFFQSQAGLTLYLIAEAADEWASVAELVRTTTLLEAMIDPSDHKRAEWSFRSRVLSVLLWFGLIESKPLAANDEWGNKEIYRKTPLYDRFLAFDA